MPEMPGSWERILKEAVGAGEQWMVQRPEGYREVGLLEGLGNIGRAWLEEQAPWMKEQKEYGSEEEIRAALRAGEVPLTEAMLRADAIRALAKGAKGYLKGAKALTDPMMEAQIRTNISNVLREARKAPQDLWDTIREVQWKALEGKTMGSYVEEFAGPGRDIGLVKFDPTKAEGSTVWHELAHGRQYSPGGEKVPYRAYGMEEEEASEYARTISRMLQTGKTRAQYEEEWYSDDPIEIAARVFAEKMLKEPGRYEELYPKILGRSIEHFERTYPKEASQAFGKWLIKGAE